MKKFAKASIVAVTVLGLLTPAQVSIAADKPFVVSISGKRMIQWAGLGGSSSLTFKVSPSNVKVRCMVYAETDGGTEVEVGFQGGSWRPIFNLTKSKTLTYTASWSNIQGDRSLGIDNRVNFTVVAECNNGKRTKKLGMT